MQKYIILEILEDSIVKEFNIPEKLCKGFVVETDFGHEHREGCEIARVSLADLLVNYYGSRRTI